MPTILIVDDERKIRRVLGELFEDLGWNVTTAEDAGTARARLDASPFDLVVTDVRLPDGDGIQILEYARGRHPDIPVVLITAYGTVGDAVRAMQLGAFDFVQKPFDLEALRLVAERAVESVRVRDDLRVLRSQTKPRRSIDGESPAIRQLREMITTVAPTPTTVLLTGESGTGKELAAEAIHAASPACERPLVRINCLAIPAELMESELFGHARGAFTGATQARKGWFELANGGTLFLDEIADLPMGLQGKLLRALEERRITRVGGRTEIPVNTRLIAATNVDLMDYVRQGRFRSDLYYRLNVFPLELPPLRERKEDISALATSLLTDLAARFGRGAARLAPETLRFMEAYDWPGNVRELRNCLERAVVLARGGEIRPEHLPPDLRRGSASQGPGAPEHGGGLPPELDCPEGTPLSELVERYKAHLLLCALRATGWVKKDAADRLGLSPRAFSHYVTKFDLDKHRSSGR